MGLSQQSGDLHVSGVLTAGTNVPSTASVSNAQVSATAAIAATKLQHQHSKTDGQKYTEDAVAERRKIHRVYGATGLVVSFSASVAVAVGATTTVSVDLRKNGTSILSGGLITLTSANAIHVAEDAPGFTSTALVAGDELEWEITVSGANLPKGVSAHLVVREDAAP